MVTKLKLTGARLNDTDDGFVLIGQTGDGAETEVEFEPGQAEEMMAALASVSGAAQRRNTKDNSQKKILPMTWWHLYPHQQDEGGLILSFRIEGGMELNFHLGSTAVPRYREALDQVTGGGQQTAPPGLRN